MRQEYNHIGMEREPMMSAARVQSDDDDWENVAEVEMTKKLSQLQLQNGQQNQRDDRWGTASMGMSSPVSRGGIAAVSASEPLDSVLVAALDNPRERLTLLQFEDQIVKFIRSGREQQLVFPPLSSYHRLIIHRLAERCNLEHQTAEYTNPYAGGYDGNSSRVVTLFKTPKCFVPSILLINLSSEQSQQPPRHHTIAPKIMTRSRNTDKQKKHPKAINNDTRTRNLEDREKAYAEARARIFGTDSETTPSQSTENTEKAIKAVKATVVEKNERPRPQNWKESKVTWRNREQEMNDPDFTRHRTPYRAPSPSYSNGYYVVNPNEYSRTEYNYRQTPPPPPEYYGQSSLLRQPSSFNSYPRAAPIPNEKLNFACDNDFPPLGQ